MNGNNSHKMVFKPKIMTLIRFTSEPIHLQKVQVKISQGTTEKRLKKTNFEQKLRKCRSNIIQLNLICIISVQFYKPIFLDRRHRKIRELNANKGQ